MLLSSRKSVAAAALIATLSISFAGQATASNYYSKERMYRVTVTNVTKTVQFTPILTATHRPSVGFFEAGSAPSKELAMLAEGGATAPLQGVLDGLSQVASTTSVGPLLSGGETRTFEISSRRNVRYLSMAAMLLPTNDSFMGLDTVALPVWGSVTYFARGYDAGSEMNDELCSSIPGPVCGGDGSSQGDIRPGAEGFVHISSGIHGIGNIGVGAPGNASMVVAGPAEAAAGAARYDWRDAVAKVTIKRIR